VLCTRIATSALKFLLFVQLSPRPQKLYLANPSRKANYSKVLLVTLIVVVAKAACGGSSHSVLRARQLLTGQSSENHLVQFPPNKSEQEAARLPAAT
jgi:hypothetical protein